MTHHALLNSSFVTDQKRTDIPDFKTGSLVEVAYSIKEGEKNRTQLFKGIVLNRKGGSGMDASFTVLRNSTAGIKIERTFPLHSPFIERITVTQLQRTKQSKPYYLRTRKEPTKAAKTTSVKAK